MCVFSILFITFYTVCLQNIKKEVTISVKFVRFLTGLAQLPAVWGCEQELPARPLNNLLLLWCSGPVSCYIHKSKVGPHSSHSFLLVQKRVFVFIFAVVLNNQGLEPLGLVQHTKTTPALENLQSRIVNGIYQRKKTVNGIKKLVSLHS